MAELESSPGAFEGLEGDALRAEFHAQTARIPWRELQPHYARGAVVLVSPGLDLVDVAVLMRQDDREQFERWIAEGSVAGVSDERAADWFEANPEVWAVVVAPWVLVQEVAESAA